MCFYYLSISVGFGRISLCFIGLICICRVALEFLREIRLRQQTDLDASRGQGTRVFGLGVVFVDEAAAWSGPSLDLEHTIEEISSIILTESERPVPLHIAKLQDVFEAEGLRSSVGGFY